MSADARFVRIMRHVLAELYRQIDDLYEELEHHKPDGVGLDVEAPFDPWRFE
jgi:hypothetical protein